MTTVSFPSPTTLTPNELISISASSASSQQQVDSSGNSELRSIALVLDSLRTNTNKSRVEKKNSQEPEVVESKRKPEPAEVLKNGSDRFKFFGNSFFLILV